MWIGVFMVRVYVGPDNRLLDAARGDSGSGIGRVSSGRKWDKASTAWAAEMDVRRLILIVERVETDSGVWVLDGADQHADLQAVIERGSEALPKAKFIPKP
jgi:hypothetical protein